MARNKRENEEILNVVEIAKKYIELGYKVGQAVSMAQKDFREQEIEQYEK